MNMTDKLVKVNFWIRKKIKINKTSSLLQEIKKFKINNSIHKINNQMEDKAVWILSMAILIKRKMTIMIINTKLNQEYLYQNKIRILKIKEIIK